MEKIVFLDRATLAPQIRLSRPLFEHEFIEYDHTSADQVAARLAGATIAITNKVPLTAEVLAQLPALKFVAVAATGTDCIDKAACERHGIRVSNIRGYAVNTVPEHTFALMLALRRNLVAYRDDVLNGEWQKSGQFCFFNHPIHDLGGMTLGIIGEGVLGQRVAEIAKAFGMRVLFAAHKGREGLGPLYTPWDEMLATSDVITIHSPLTPQTRGMLSTPEFRAMKRKPLIINTARGGLVDEDALVRALDEGLIGGIGFDVLSSEPPTDDNPLMRIAKRPNVIVTPHVAWASDEAQQSLADQLMDNIHRFVCAEPANLVV
ncbi:D-2-hydroxyacid dehydrogenase [Paraburkholderia silviterrae]|uniref:D-2-hydroxyacid dehydrogenase n=1 Tax=Paraburkholderia silviterrae TaxID=2528715 RepID=A0A4R5M5C0_9BURK|nr:D-2-hydroxyacid dehydrogenase [Paraburkholderia silviterrae]TDG21007.1 D-2-hydroxyacid dehydrogenase [Paraburkholderia silviterrae]